ncbi:MAG TPA: amino acid permease [Thermoanaerobaculia bacterium]|nr:amino acid permease [Thermoanaerobaculia bacterium]
MSATPRRSIGLATAVGLVLGEMIGVGIFLTPAGMAKGLGSFGLVLAVWLGMGAAALCGALCYGELAARHPQAGGLYVYLREAYGPRVAFLYGWQCLLVLDPGLSAALATGIGAYGATLLPGLQPAVFVYLVPLRAVGSPETFAAQAGAVLFGERGAQTLSLVVILCVGSSLLAYMTAAPRVYYAMARDGLAVGAMGELHSKTGAPLRAIAVQAALASLLVLLGRFDQIVGYFVFVLVLFLAASVTGLFRLRRRDGVRVPYLTPAFPLPAIGFLVMTAVVLILLAAGQPLQAAAGVAVTCLGVPVYAWLKPGEAEPV